MVSVDQGTGVDNAALIARCDRVREAFIALTKDGSGPQQNPKRVGNAIFMTAYDAVANDHYFLVLIPGDFGRLPAITETEPTEVEDISVAMVVVLEDYLHKLEIYLASKD